MPSQRRLRWRGEAIVFAALLLLAACAGPELPLLSPLEQAKVYGYAETPLGDNRYAVTYQGPSRLILNFAPDRDRAAAAARTQAYDFALWRAAQIAEAQGYPGLRVTDRQSDVDTMAQPAYYDSSFYAPFGPGSDLFHDHHGMPFGGADDAGYFSPPSPYAEIRARARIDVEVLREPGSQDLRVDELLARMRKAYPDAEKLPGGGQR